MPVTLISSSADFKRAISQNKLTVVDFYAVWCGPCKAIAPKFESFSSTYSNAAFIKVNVDDLNDVAASCSVRAMPTFQFYRNGKKIDEVVGANVYDLEAKIKKHVSTTASSFSGAGHVLGTGETLSTNSGSANSPVPAGSSTQNWLYLILGIVALYWLFGSSDPNHKHDHGHSDIDLEW